MKRVQVFKPTTAKGNRVFNSRAAIDALYDSAEWKSFSKRFLEINDKCYACGKKSNVTDHLKTHKGNESLFKQNDNVIPLCIKCHNTVTALFDRWGKQKYEEKLKWLSTCRLHFGLTFKVKVIPYKA